MAKVAKTLRSLGDHLQVGASVRNVYGDPVNVGGRTVIPIARVSYGFGAGGRGGESEEPGSERGGSGWGAGLSARPVGAFEITEAGARFIPFIDPNSGKCGRIVLSVSMRLNDLVENIRIMVSSARCAPPRQPFSSLLLRKRKSPGYGGSTRAAPSV